jgi:hypothetical protein
MSDQTEDTLPTPVTDIPRTHWIHLTSSQGRELRLLMGVTVRFMEEITDEDGPAKTRLELAWPMHMGGLVGMMPGQMPSISMTTLDVLEDIDEVTAAIEDAMKYRRKAARDLAYNYEIANLRMQQGADIEGEDYEESGIGVPSPMVGGMLPGVVGGFFYGPDNDDLDLDPDHGQGRGSMNSLR